VIDGEQYQKGVNETETQWLESESAMVTDLQELVDRIEREVVTSSSSTQ
jgi:hypothetical protein